MAFFCRRQLLQFQPEAEASGVSLIYAQTRRRIVKALMGG